jgi:hypothetical protein
MGGFRVHRPSRRLRSVMSKVRNGKRLTSADKNLLRRNLAKARKAKRRAPTSQHKE